MIPLATPAAAPDMGFAIVLMGMLMALTFMTYRLTPNPVALFGFGLSLVVTGFWFIGIVSIVIVMGTYMLHGLAMAALSAAVWWLK